MSEEKKEKLMKDFWQRIKSPMLCQKCLSDPGATTFSAECLISYCEHERTGLFLMLSDFQIIEPLFCFFPVSKTEFYAIISMLTMFMASVKNVKDKMEGSLEGLLERLPEKSFGQS